MLKQAAGRIAALGVLAALAVAVPVPGQRVAVAAGPTSLSNAEVVRRAGLECAAAASYFGQRGNDAALADKLLAGILVADTHPDFVIPANPTFDEPGDGTASWRFYYGSLLWLDPLRREGVRRGNQQMLDRYAELWHQFITADTSQARWVWADMADGLRAQGLACAISTLGARSELLGALATHGAWLDDLDHYVVIGNHAMHQNSGLFVAGYVLGNDQWRSHAVNRQTALFEVELDDAGGNTEGSVMYTTLNKFWMDDARALMTAAGIPLPDTMTEPDRFGDFLGYATTPDGHYEMLGDTQYDFGLTYSGGKVVPIISPFMAGTVAQWARTRGRLGTKPASTLATFPTGYLFQRSGWGEVRPYASETAYSLRYGFSRTVAVHSHQDHGSITLYSHGSQLLWDQGMYDYNGGAFRVAVMSAQEHNRVSVDGLSYSRTSSSPLALLDDTGAYTLATVKVRDMPGITWYRTVWYSKKGRYLVVLDSLASDQPHGYITNWHLGLDRTIEFTPARDAAYTKGSGANVSLFLAGTGTATSTLVRGQRTQPLVGWRSLARGKVVPSPVVRSTRTGTAVTFVTVVVPRPAGALPSTVGVDRLAVSSGKATLRVRAGTIFEQLTLTHRTVVLRSAA